MDLGHLSSGGRTGRRPAALEQQLLGQLEERGPSDTVGSRCLSVPLRL